MARMIPLHIPAATPSAAERQLFDEFQRACPDDWIVLHSLDLARRGTGPFGETDFVVVAPELGVMCVEAKTYLARGTDGLWIVSPTEPPSSKSPFHQADNGQYRIGDWLEEHRLPRILLTSVVIVPEMDILNKDSIEWAPWRLIDRARYHSKSLELLVRDTFAAQAQALENPPVPLTQDLANRVVRTLRSEIECYISPKARIAQQIDEARRYTEEQFRVLDQLSENPRLLVDGLAGTGKTMLAIESARRAVGSGRKVLFLCFNTLLSEWLVEETASLGDACTTCTIHQYMQSIVGDEEPGLRDTRYYEETLPERAANVLANRVGAGKPAPFDELVIDEAQDILLNADDLMVLDNALVGGLLRGRWRFFGDFTYQDIFGRLGETPREQLAQILGFAPPIVSLRENCRNLPRVSHMAAQLAGMQGSGYTVCRREDDGFNPAVFYYDGAKTARKALVAALDMLRAEGFEPGQIVVLSRRSAANCLAAKADQPPWSDRLRPVVAAGSGYTGYDSIFRFKGREAPAIVVTDIDPLEAAGRWSNEADARALLYVAATRSLSRFVLIAHEEWRERLALEPMDGTGLEMGESGARDEPPTE